MSGDLTKIYNINKQKLKNTFDFEMFAKNLLFLGKFADELDFKVEESDSKIAIKLRDHMMLKSKYMDSRLKDTLVYLEGINLINRYGND